jgi:glycosyltransferase involved in cell wall biosynthesis
MKSLAIVVPCYNEAQTLPETAVVLLRVLDALHVAGKIAANSRVYFIDDGSVDETWRVITSAAEGDSRISGIKLSRNYGHQNALLAGLLNVAEDMVVSIDADLQDDVAVIEKMVDAHREGKDIVFGVREDRSADTWAKRAFAEGYYKLLRRIGVDIVFNHADYRLMSRRALETLREYSEINIFLRGVIPTIGFPTAVVPYVRNGRTTGESKYSIRKMLSLALHGITAFSTLPLRLIAAFGFIIFAATLLLSIWVLWVRLVSPDVVPGWASSVLPMYFLGGVQLLSIGILGEYIGKIYAETKRRPRYVIERRL